MKTIVEQNKEFKTQASEHVRMRYVTEVACQFNQNKVDFSLNGLKVTEYTFREKI